MEEKRRMAFTVQWHITSLCPNRCKHCYINDKVDDSISFDNFRIAYQKISSFEEKYHVHIARITLTGGDPFLNPDFWRILEFLKEQHKEISILGIPERITETNISRLKACGVNHYQVSLDGLEESHDKIRGKGSFQRTIQAVRKLVESKIEHTIMYTVNSLNYSDLVPLIHYLDRNKIQTNFAFDFMVGDITGDETVLCMLPPEKVHKLLQEYFEVDCEFKAKVSTVKLQVKNRLSRVLKYYSSSKENHDVLQSPFYDGCACGLYGLAILPNGDVFPCRRLPIKVGNIFENDVDQILLHNKLMQSFRDSSAFLECGSCLYFNVCRGCPAVSFYYTGSPFSKNPYCFIKNKTENIYSSKCSSIEEIMQCVPNAKTNISKKDHIIHLLEIYSKIRENEEKITRGCK